VSCEEDKEERLSGMKFRIITTLIILFLASASAAVAQSSAVENLRSQLSDVQKREGELQARVRQLEEDMRPESLEKFFALNGSTRPEELRAERRRQLENERTRVLAQLDQLGQSRVRLETSIATAEAAAYRQSALPDSYGPAPAVNVSTPTVKPKPTPRRARRKASRRAPRRG
jgi:Skp family chaperone for outer membrane proteins